MKRGNIIYGKYYATEDGKIWNEITKKELKPRLQNGYHRVNIRFNKKVQKKMVHRLVWESFNGKIPKNLTINHIDGKKLNNWVQNLELMTNLDNIRHARKLFNWYRSKPYKVLCIELNKKFNSIADAAKFINVHHSTLSRFFSGDVKTCGGFTWKKLED